VHWCFVCYSNTFFSRASTMPIWWSLRQVLPLNVSQLKSSTSPMDTTAAAELTGVCRRRYGGTIIWVYRGAAGIDSEGIPPGPWMREPHCHCYIETGRYYSLIKPYCRTNPFQQGETVLDLGSGSRINIFLAASKIGPHRIVIGLDMFSVCGCSTMQVWS
jgi:hypothetical protein